MCSNTNTQIDGNKIDVVRIAGATRRLRNSHSCQKLENTKWLIGKHLRFFMCTCTCDMPKLIFPTMKYSCVHSKNLSSIFSQIYIFSVCLCENIHYKARCTNAFWKLSTVKNDITPVFYDKRPLNTESLNIS